MNENIKEDGNKGKISASIILALVTCFMLFLYAPLELLFTNQDEFFFDMYILIPPIMINFMLFFIISIVVFFLARRTKWYYVILCVYFIAFISLYIQGNFMVDWLPTINGSIVEWEKFQIERVKSIALWILVTALVLLIYRKKGKEFIEKVISVTSACMGLMLLLTIIILCISTGGYHKKQIYSTATAKNILTMSEDKNFVILLLDAVDASVLNEIIKEEIKYKEVFKNFTYYTNTMSGYPYTVHSIPLILTGEWYEKQCDFEDFEKQAYSNSPLFNNLEEAGYRMGVYETDFRLEAADQSRFENILNCQRRLSSYFTVCKWQIQMTGYRYAPFDLKRFCYVYSNAFNELKVLPEGEEVFQSSNLFFWDKLCNEEIELVGEKCFRFIHVEGAHAPYQYDEKMNVVEDGKYENAVKASMTIVDKYLEKLRNAGVYDNSCIIIMADHGHVAGFNDNPILFIKGFNEQHEMEMNDAPISHEDLQEAYAWLLRGKNSDGVFDYQEGDYRERRFLFQDDDNNPLQIMKEYVQKGHAGNGDTLKQIREF